MPILFNTSIFFLFTFIYNIHYCLSIHQNERNSPQFTRMLLVIGIASKNEHYEHRQMIRQTWLRKLPPSVKYHFLLGRNKKEEDSPLDLHFDDVFVCDIIDSYQSVLYKTITYVQWSLEKWNPMYFMKTDDDTYVSLNKILEYLESIQPQERIYYGHFSSMPPIHNKEHKNCFRKEAYPLPLLPVFALGACYVWSNDIMKFLSKNMNELIQSTQFFACTSDASVEDAQLALWIMPLGIQPIHDHRLSDYSNCHYESIALFDVSPIEMKLIHEAFLSQQSLCINPIIMKTILYYQKLLDIDPAFLVGYNNIAVHYILLGEYEIALSYINQGLEYQSEFQAFKSTKLFIQQIIDNQKECKKNQHCLQAIRTKIENTKITAGKRLGLPFYARNQEWIRQSIDITSLF